MQEERTDQRLSTYAARGEGTVLSACLFAGSCIAGVLAVATRSGSFVALWILLGIAFWVAAWVERIRFRRGIARRTLELPVQAGQAALADGVSPVPVARATRALTEAARDAIRSGSALRVRWGVRAFLWRRVYWLTYLACLILLAGAFVGGAEALFTPGPQPADFFPPVTPYRGLTVLLNLFLFLAALVLGNVAFWLHGRRQSGHAWSATARKAPSHLAAVLASGAPFALYLRSFAGEEPVVEAVQTDIGGGVVLHHRDFDSKLVARVRDVVPVYLLGNLDDPRPPVGCLPLYVDDDRWHLVARELIGLADVIVVFIAQVTPSLLVELSEVLRQERHARTVVILDDALEVPAELARSLSLMGCQISRSAAETRLVGLSVDGPEQLLAAFASDAQATSGAG